jgi:hypothetical protein
MHACSQKEGKKKINTVVRMHAVCCDPIHGPDDPCRSLSTGGAVVVVVQLAVAGKRRVRYSCWIRPAMR